MEDAWDLFEQLDQEYDGYLRYDELENLKILAEEDKDEGQAEKLLSDEGLNDQKMMLMKKKFHQIGNENINFEDFCIILKELDLDLPRIRQNAYRKNYGKHCRNKLCFKLCFMIRKS